MHDIYNLKGLINNCYIDVCTLKYTKSLNKLT